MAAYSDNDFLDEQWSLVLQPEAAPTTVVREITGGNPGAYRRVSNVLTPSQLVAYGFHIRPGASYVPTALGAIQSIAYSLDARVYSAAFAEGMGLGVALRQGGVVYYGGTHVTGTQTGVWKTYSAAGLTASDFRTRTDPNQHPDFSGSGAPIEFGFLTWNSSVGTGFTTIAGFDNWSVTVESVGVPALDSPVTLHMSESLTGVFADPTIDATFFNLVDLPVGSRYSVGDHISGRTWYTGTIRDKSIQGGLTSYTLETLLATLGRVTPREALILVAGEGGVPDPLTLRECLIRFLTYYGVPFDPDVPEFYLRAGEELVVPTVPAFVIQPDQLSPASIYEQLEPFYGVFRSYTFRADEQNRLVVRPPAWVDTIGVRLTLWRRRQENDRTPTRQTNGVPWSTTRKPTVEWTATVDGVAYAGALPAALELGAPLQDIHIGPVTVRIQWRSSDGRVQASVWPPPPVDLTVGNLFSITITLRPETLPGDEDELLGLTVNDLGPDEVQTSSADTVINQAVIPVRPRTFQPAQQIMQAAAMVLASPGGLMPGLFGNTPFGPMDEELETPNGFLELVNDTVQEGAWFWPADEAVVIQPGGNITVAFDVEEWAEQWRDASAPHAAASQVNTFSDTFDLPANGAEVRLFDFQFPRQTTNFAPSPYGARGTVFGRWRAGENSGIELRVANSHFVEFGYLPEMGIFGQTVYFLWGAIVKLNGTGTTFTVGDLHTYRFGFSRGADGLWEDGANMPGLSESQALYPNRVYTAPELPYEVTAEVALAMARGIVEENLTPKVVYNLTVPATRPDGYAVGPWHMGRAASIPALGVTGRVTSLDYGEAHTAQAQGDTSLVTIEVETTAAPAGSRAAATGYRRAAYGLSHYQQEE